MAPRSKHNPIDAETPLNYIGSEAFFHLQLCSSLDESRPAYTTKDNQYSNTYELPRELMRVIQLLPLELSAGGTFV